MIVKFNPEGHVVMVFGRKKEASDEAEPWSRDANPPLPPDRRPCSASRPTSTWNAQGDIFISDGYVNSRVAKYDKNGDWVKSFGEPGKRPGSAEHAAQHRQPTRRATSTSPIAATVASRCSTATASFCGRSRSTCPCRPALQPVDRQRPRIPKRRRPTMAPGTPWAICITPGPNQVLYAADAFPGRIYKLDLQGRVLGMLGRAGKTARSSSAGSTRSRVRRRTSCTSPRC